MVQEKKTIGAWKTQPIVCNLCGADDTSNLWVKDGFTYVRCNACGLSYVNPQLVASEIERIYALGFQSKSEGKPTPTNFATYQPILRWASAYRQTGYLLDIGCFKGHLLLAAREKGWAVAGTEISEQAANSGRREGLDIFLGSLPEARYPDAHFDIVVMQDVVEHLANPQGYLREVLRVLRPGGGLYIETPNLNSVTRYVFGKDWSVFFPWHQYYFTARTLKRMLEQAGFEIPRIECIGISPVSRYNALRSLQSRGEIVSASSRRLKSFIELRVPFFKKPLLFFLSLLNIPFRILSRLGIYLGTKMIVFVERPVR